MVINSYFDEELCKKLPLLNFMRVYDNNTVIRNTLTYKRCDYNGKTVF